MGYAMKKRDNGMVKGGMGKDLRALKPANTKTVLATLAPDPWAGATDVKRATADARLAVLGVAARGVLDGATVNSAAEYLFEQMSNRLTTSQKMAIDQLGMGAVSLPTLKRWLGAYKKQGKAGLLPSHTGRQRVDYGWEARAIELYNIGGKPDPADVAFRLIGEGFEGITASRVKSYLKTLPATLGKNSPKRIGKHLHDLTKKNYTERTLENLKAGDVYVGDGHTIDCYLSHDTGKRVYRCELTMFIDLKSRYPVGWWISDSESGTATLFAISESLTRHNHIPLFVYVDTGSGYKAKIMTDKNVGFFSRFGIKTTFALPGNPHGKGWIERFFKTIRNKHDKFFDDGNAYCGADMAPEINRRISVEYQSGKRKLKSLDEYVASLTQFFKQYSQTPMPKALAGQTPEQVWRELVPFQIGSEMSAVMRPSKICRVARQSVRLKKRRYYHEALALFDGKGLRVEYSLHNDSNVWIYTLDGQFVCVAKLTKKVNQFSNSILQDQADERLRQQIKRKQASIDEDIERAAPIIDMDVIADRLETPSTDLLEPASVRSQRAIERSSKIIIDITD